MQQRTHARVRTAAAVAKRRAETRAAIYFRWWWVTAAQVLVNGGTVASRWIKANATSVLEAWYPGQEGGRAVVAVST